MACVQDVVKYRRWMSTRWNLHSCTQLRFHIYTCSFMPPPKCETIAYKCRKREQRAETGPLDPVITRFWTATRAPGVPLLIPATYTRDQPLANRDIYTLVKVGRCYPAVVESRRMPGIIRPRAKPALAASRTLILVEAVRDCECLCAYVGVCVSAEHQRKVSSIVEAC